MGSMTLLGAGYFTAAPGGGGGGPSADFSDDFARADSGTVGGSWTSETDASSKLSIVSNQLQFLADTSGTTGYLTKNITSSAIVTVKFKMSISVLTSVSSGVGTFSPCRIYNSGASSPLAMMNIVSNNDIFNYNAVRGNFAESASAVNFLSPALVAGTLYDCYLYFVNSATVGGAECKIGPWTASSTGFNDDTSVLGNAALIRFGGVSNGWGAGANDPIVIFDDVNVYYGVDAR